MEDAAIEALDAPFAAPTTVTEPPAAVAPETELDGHTARRSPAEAQQLVLDLIAAHADSLLRTARRYSLCADDAQDAYQRGLEILMRHAHRLDADRAGGWLHTVVKREAMAINRSRRRFVGGDEVDLDALETRTSPSPEDRVLGFERVARSAEALQRLKPQEVRALWLKAMGNSYQEICDQTGWTYTKVNRCLAEGRKSFLARYAGIEAGEECRRWAPVLSAIVDGEASAEQMLELRPHLRNCAGCRAALRELRGSSAPLAALFPVGGLAFAGGEGAPLDGAGDVLGRLWHSLWGDLSEKAATAAFRAQSAAHGLLPGGLLPGKAVATAASALALAGGGYSVEGAHEPVSPPRAVLHAQAPSTAVQQLTIAARTATAAPLVVPEPAVPAAHRSAPRRAERSRAPRARRRTVVRAVRASRPTRAQTISAGPAATPTATPSRAPAVAPVPRPTAAAPSHTAAPPRPAATRSGASGEFGLERR
jgi:RNA polymerase sigma factor (sigma-70 family)